MTLPPALVDRHDGPMTGNKGGPNPLANPAATWSRLANDTSGFDPLPTGQSVLDSEPETPPILRLRMTARATRIEVGFRVFEVSFDLPG